MTPRSIAVLGAGQIGSAFAFKLAAAGHNVTAIARPGSTRLAQLREAEGVTLESGEIVRLRIATELDESVAYDLVVVAIPAHRLAPVLPALRRSAARAVEFMLVTFEPAALEEAVGAERCSFGMPFLTALLADDGRLRATFNAYPKTLHGESRWAELFDDAGIPSAREARMPRWLRCHAPLTVAFESIAFRARQRGRGATWRDAGIVARGLKGGLAIARGPEQALYPRSKALLAASPIVTLRALLWLASRNAAFRNLLASGVDECRALAGRIAAAGESMGPTYAAPVVAVRATAPVD